MEITWRAVGYGFAVTVILGVLSGATLPYTDFTLPSVSHAVIGLIGGLVAGYMTMGSDSGTLNGLLATIIGGLVVLGVLGIIGTLATGLIGLSITLFALFMLVLSGVPGAIGGYVGARYHRRRTTRDEQRAVPR